MLWVGWADVRAGAVFVMRVPAISPAGTGCPGAQTVRVSLMRHRVGIWGLCLVHRGIT